MNRQVQYNPRTEFASGRSQFVKHPPNNGTTFEGGDTTGKFPTFCEWNLRSDDFIDGSKTMLNATFKAVPVASAVAANQNAFSNGSLNCAIRRVEVLSPGGGVIEMCDDWNRQFLMLSNVGTSVQQTGLSGSATDLYEDISTGDQTVAAGGGSWSGGRSTGVKLNVTNANGAATDPPVCDEFHCSIPLSLSSIFGPNNTKFIPMCALDGPLILRVYWTPVWQEAYCTYAADNAGAAGGGVGSNFNLTNVSLSLNHIRYDPETYMRIKESIDAAGSVEYDAVQYISSSADVSYASDRVLLGNTSYRSVAAIYAARYFPVYAPSYVFNCAPGNGERSAVFEVNGERVRGTPLSSGISSNLLTNVAPFAMSTIVCSRAAKDIHDCNSQLVPQERTSSTLGKSAGFTNLNDVAIVPNTYVAALPPPTNAPTQLAATLSKFGGVSKALDGYFWMNGFDLTEVEGGTGHNRRGRDMRGKQCVYVTDVTNNITATQLCRLQCSLVVNCKMIIENGTMRCERD